MLYKPIYLHLVHRAHTLLTVMKGIGIIGGLVGILLLVLAIPQANILFTAIGASNSAPSGAVTLFAVGALVFTALIAIVGFVYTLSHL